MDESYDAIVLGTGLKECVLSGLLSVDGLKVLHIDRNNYYGGESASLSLQQLFERFRPGQQPPKSLGPSRDYNVDMVPKFIMNSGELVRVLVHTDVTKYLEFKGVDGSFVQNKGRVEKVPATDYEALRSPLLGLFEKRRLRNFLLFVQEYDESNPKTQKGYDLRRMPMAALYKEYGLDPMTVDFIGHAIALHRDDAYMGEPALATVKKIRLYYDSLMRFEGTSSPYIYPLYGLGELPQAFARLSAVYGGTYMLSKPDAQVAYENGVAVGVTADGETAKAKLVVGDPSYFPDKVSKTSRVVRAACILSHPIPNTNNSASAQIILPQKQVNRRSDIYVFSCSASHNVVPKDKWLAFVSTTVETSNPEAELAPGLALLGPFDEKFVDVVDVYEPLESGQRDKCFISKGYDATSHFETTVEDILEMYTRITGKVLDLSSKDVSQAAQ
ncbi:rab GDP dissociation inhibitor protein [Coccomyxa subellipsoidea C-169]|uniref:Guanosine nucleotide diphosphate dissociation inhibitor n=1 Tax=Coccomyxa subellipsoidea (strain C-169) TaxID=574566 RepID=I0YXM2_COCSC|nr:rab GDP dissociation inhibitor protein [Coccomyxa subellipsoidea C-169]EIE23141.1 rab GDP dissociation inhibitor protein [Coccomyxa subellipsoidea C-169]|eukprot:XP_005647685.1 rab GDP dissociation inhibitor protein [Coccomyxa subellipsoidea C-169]